MEEKSEKRKPGPKTMPVALGVAGGSGIGLLVGRTMAGPGTAAVTRLAESVATQAALQTAGPIIGAAIVGSSSILAAVAVPVVVMWALKKEDQ